MDTNHCNHSIKIYSELGADGKLLFSYSTDNSEDFLTLLQDESNPMGMSVIAEAVKASLDEDSAIEIVISKSEESNHKN